MLCEAICGIEVEVEGGRVTSVRGDKKDPFSRGHICPKAAALPDLSYDPDRVVTPLRRVGETFHPVAWDEALDEAASRIADIQKRYGRSAFAAYFGNPTVHSPGALLATALFTKVLGTRTRFSATSVDQLPQMLASLMVFGNQVMMPVPDLDRTKLLFVFGGNPLVSNGSIMTAPDVKKRLEGIRARGGRIVVFDPRRTETAQIADEHQFVRPGSDAMLLASMLHVLFAERRVAWGHLEDHLTNVRKLELAVMPFSPEKVEARVGLSAETIRRLARELGSTRDAAAYGRVGMCTQEFGALAAWLLLALNIATAHLDREGGMMFASPAIDLVGLSRALGETGHFGVWKSRVRGLPEFGGELPIVTLAEEIETPGEGQIRGLLTHAGNPVLSSPNGARLDRALAGLDFMVSIDLYRNETTRHAHLILPTSFGLERDHYDVALYAYAVRNAARFAPAVIDKPNGVRDDFDLLTDLGLRIHKARGRLSPLGGRRRTAAALTLRGARALGMRRTLDWLLRTGPHGVLRGGRLSLKALLEDHPHGIDLGALEPRLVALLARGRRIDVAPEAFTKDLPRLETALARPSPELVLIGRRQLRSNNSWMHNSLRLVKGRDACTLLMHPDDAERRALRTGDRVRVRSRVGAVVTRVEVSDTIGRGVVSLPHGWGHGRPNVALGIAREHAGASVNDVTDETFIDALSGTAALSGVEVDVVRIEEDQDTRSAVRSVP
jgi:anaerobic selenocysteine-containing dehydrogenase